MNLNLSRREDAVHVVQIALGVAIYVFMIAIYIRPVPAQPTNERVREIRTQQTVYQIEVKYLTHEKPPF